MLRNFKRCLLHNKCARVLYLPRLTFLTNDYKCTDDWNSQSASLHKKINLNDFYTILDQNYSSKGVISAIDVDVFANTIKDSVYLEELKDLLHKLRLSAETGNTLESTHHATIRNFIEFGNLQDLLLILKDPLNFGIFLDSFTANMLLDKLVTSENYELAAKVASLIMLQEDFSNEITNTLSQYACFKYLSQDKPSEEAEIPVQNIDKKEKKEEIKIRVKYLRNPYFDDHFDITDLKLLSGKTLAWMSNISKDNLNNNLQIVGWLFYQKYDKLLALCEELTHLKTFRVYTEVIEVMKKESEQMQDDTKNVLQKCVELLSKISLTDTKLEESLKIAIENAINKVQNKDIAAQKQIFKEWEKVRQEKLQIQLERLDRVKRMKHIEEKQKSMEVDEQKLWFFENEENIDLQIEEKEQLVDKSGPKKAAQQKSDEDYIPPEILPKRK